MGCGSVRCPNVFGSYTQDAWMHSASFTIVAAAVDQGPVSDVWMESADPFPRLGMGKALSIPTWRYRGRPDYEIGIRDPRAEFHNGHGAVGKSNEGRFITRRFRIGRTRNEVPMERLLHPRKRKGTRKLLSPQPLWPGECTVACHNLFSYAPMRLGPGPHVKVETILYPNTREEQPETRYGYEYEAPKWIGRTLA